MKTLKVTYQVPVHARPPRSRFRWATHMRAALNCLALFTATACTPTHVIQVDMTRPRPEVLDTPRAIGAGDIVRVMVIDTIWGNSYAVGINSAAINAVERNLVFGGGSLQKLSQSFAPVVLPSSGRRDDTGAGLAFTLATSCPLPPGIAQATVDEQLALLNQAWARLDELRDSIQTTVQLLSSNPFDAVRAFASNAEIRRIILAAAEDPLPVETAELLSRLLANTRAPRPEPEELDALVVQVRDYARRVEGIVALVPAAALTPDVRLGLATFREQVLRYRDLHDAASALRRQLTVPSACVTGTLPARELSLSRHGVDLSPLVNNPALDPAALDLALRRIVHNTELLAGVFNALPAWSVGPAEQLALERSFEGNKEVTVAILRRPRYGHFEARVAEAPRTSQSGTKKGEAITPADAGAGAPSLAETRTDTVALIRFETYPRYRFHVGAGFVRSPLSTRSYETTADTVDGVPGLRIREAGRTPFQAFPVAVLSYSIFPAAGQIFDARVRPGWPSLVRSGLAVHAGLSLNDPTEDLVFGLSTEPVPGVRVGAGYHLSYVQVARAGAGAFVPATAGPAVERRWRGEWGAVNVAVDAKVFFETIGALLK
jgi:hypothetical protein